MRTEDAIDKLCDIAPIIADIGEKAKNDQEFKDFMAGYNKAKDNRMFVLRVLPILVKHYKEDAYAILSIWTEKPIDEIKEQSLGVTIKEMKAIFEDEDIRAFFSSFSEPKKTAAE